MTSAALLQLLQRELKQPPPQLLVPAASQPPLVPPKNTGGCGAAGGALGERKRTRPGSVAALHGSELVRELGPEEVRWFYKEDKAWKPFVGYDSLRIELAFRTLLQVTGGLGPAVSPDLGHVCGRASPAGPAAAGCGVDDDEDRACGFCRRTARHEPEMEQLVNLERVCVRGGLYEVDLTQAECHPVYWNRE